VSIHDDFVLVSTGFSGCMPLMTLNYIAEETLSKTEQSCFVLLAKSAPHEKPKASS